MKKKKIAIYGSIGVFVILLVLYLRLGVVIWSSFVSVGDLDTENLPEKSVVLEHDVHLRQTGYDCGAFSIFWALQALDVEVDLEDIVETNKKKMIPRQGISPEVLVTTLERAGVESKLRTFRWHSREEKKQGLKAVLQNKPMILFLKRHGYLHFVLLVGYDGDDVLMYDPMLTRADEAVTVDTNGNVAGNDSVDFEDVIDMWDEVSVGGLYKNMAVILEP